MCSSYVLDKPLQEQSFQDADSITAVVHSYGFFIFLVGYQQGLFQNVKTLLVFDGWFPADCIFDGNEYPINLPAIRTIFFFPTFGNRREYPLEAIVRQQMIVRNDITVVRGHGFGHNILFDNFGTANTFALIVNLLASVPEERTNDLDLVVKYPSTKLEKKSWWGTFFSS